MAGSTETAAWRFDQMTAADAEIWDFWVGHSRDRWRTALLRNSFSSNYRDFELMKLALELSAFGPAALMLAGHEFRGWTSGSWKS
jgi:hypothetical protein